MRAPVESIDSPFRGEVEIPRVRHADLRAAFESVGVSLKDVQREGVRLDVDGFENDSAVVLVVTTFARNHKGERYFDPGTREVATETRRYFLYGDLHLSTD